MGLTEGGGLQRILFNQSSKSMYLKVRNLGLWCRKTWSWYGSELLVCSSPTDHWRRVVLFRQDLSQGPEYVGED